MSSTVSLSILDLCPILADHSAQASLAHVLPLAKLAEDLGYERYWFAEHHDMQGIGSSAPEVLIAHVAAQTKKIRVGSGGIMLPNHATYHIAEVFRSLEALYPGRIDLGLGRAPGSGNRATHALRRNDSSAADRFPQELSDLQQYFKDEFPLKAVPTGVNSPEIWILGSSEFGAQLAGQRGLPYSFAQHFSGLPAIEVIDFYRHSFKPSEYLSQPQVMLGCHIICAESDEVAEELALSTDAAFANLTQTGRNQPLMSVPEARQVALTAADRARIRAQFPKFVGSPSTIKRLLNPYMRAGINSFMVLSMIYDQTARQKSYQLIRECL